MPRVLLLDDEPMIAMLIDEWFSDLGVEMVGPAQCVETALAAIEKEGRAIDAAILDVTLRKGDSYPVAETLKRLRIPFAFATGLGLGGLAPPFRDAPTLHKPFVFEDLEAMIKDIGELTVDVEGHRGEKVRVYCE